MRPTNKKIIFDFDIYCARNATRAGFGAAGSPSSKQRNVNRNSTHNRHAPSANARDFEVTSKSRAPPAHSLQPRAAVCCVASTRRSLGTCCSRWSWPRSFSFYEQTLYFAADEAAVKTLCAEKSAQRPACVPKANLESGATRDAERPRRRSTRAG